MFAKHESEDEQSWSGLQQENITTGGVDPDSGTHLFKMLVFAANSLVIGLIACKSLLYIHVVMNKAVFFSLPTQQPSSSKTSTFFRLSFSSVYFAPMLLEEVA